MLKLVSADLGVANTKFNTYGIVRLLAGGLRILES